MWRSGGEGGNAEPKEEHRTTEKRGGTPHALDELVLWADGVERMLPVGIRRDLSRLERHGVDESKRTSHVIADRDLSDVPVLACDVGVNAHNVPLADRHKLHSESVPGGVITCDQERVSSM